MKNYTNITIWNSFQTSIINNDEMTVLYFVTLIYEPVAMETGHPWSSYDILKMGLYPVLFSMW